MKQTEQDAGAKVKSSKDQLSSTATRLRSATHVCKQLDISTVTLWRRINDQTLDFPKPLRISGRRYFLVEDIDQWLQAQRELA